MEKEKFVCLELDYQGKKLWCVFEYATEQVVKHFESQNDAHSYRKFLERGGAFAGFTPSFMAEN